MEDKNGLKPAFFCVPDITGFTKFIATADIKFTKNLIPALLRKLIAANILKMRIGEIEGDAIFFYKTGRLPPVGKVAEQCKIIHHGYISTANIKGRIKLLGTDVILAHKLLKNSIEDCNYILLTDKYLSKIKDSQNLDQWFHWEKLHTSMEVYEYMGEVGYHYITLDEMTFMLDVKSSTALKS